MNRHGTWTYGTREHYTREGLEIMISWTFSAVTFIVVAPFVMGLASLTALLGLTLLGRSAKTARYLIRKAGRQVGWIRTACKGQFR